ncbi:hypothetical protein V3F56_02920 [Moorellaceae bacterium AZ2]
MTGELLAEYAARMWTLYGADILVLVAALSVGWLVFQLMFYVDEKLGSRYRPRHAARTKSALIRTLQEVPWEEYYGGVAGATGGFVVLAQFPYGIWKGFIGAALGWLLGRLMGKAYLWLKRKVQEERKAGEVILLGEIISLYASSGYSLYDALSAGVYMISLIREPLQRCLRSWSQGPQRALQRFAEEVNLPEANILIGVLQRGVDIGAGNITSLLSQESYTMERIRQYRIEQGLSTRPIIQTLYFLFPGLALLGVTLMPVGYHIAKMITGLRLS